MNPPTLQRRIPLAIGVIASLLTAAVFAGGETNPAESHQNTRSTSSATTSADIPSATRSLSPKLDVPARLSVDQQEFWIHLPDNNLSSDSATTFSLAALPAFADDPLPSWNAGASKKAILEFVQRVTSKDSPDFVRPRERIAVFDNDGTLWAENPVPFQLAFAIDSLKAELPKKPEWKNDEFVVATVEGDFEKLLADGHKGLFHILSLTHSGMTTDQFAASVTDWMKSAQHPRFKRPYDQCSYQPMLEVLALLRDHNFRTYIVSGGGMDFMRVWSQRVYHIPPEHVIGSYGQTRFELRDGIPTLIKTTEHLFVDDKEGKPVAINRFIGRRPIACFGNSDGDKAMLEYTTVGNSKPSFGLIVHHTDEAREYAYAAKPKSSGKLIDALKDAPKRGWTVVSMKDDWKQIFPND